MEMDRLESMSVLMAVVEAGSLSAASRRLGTPLATVSRRISDLEAHLGTRLLNRAGRRPVPTEAGQAYVAACRRILDDIAEAERAASGEYSVPRGELIVTAPIVFGRLHVLPVVTAFLRAYPEIDIRLTLADRVVNLIEDHVDVAVRIGALPDSSLVAARVGTMRRVVCASPAYLAAHGTPATPGDLESHACVTFEGLGSPEAWSFGTGRERRQVPIRSRLTVNTAEAAIDAARDGIGLARVLFYQAAEAVADGALSVVLRAFEPPPAPVHLVHDGQRLSPFKLRAFLDFATPRLKSELRRLEQAGATQRQEKP
jgi:DNA-binding transcriptional LysR family regulator